MRRAFGRGDRMPARGWEGYLRVFCLSFLPFKRHFCFCVVFFCLFGDFFFLSCRLDVGARLTATLIPKVWFKLCV